MTLRNENHPGELEELVGKLADANRRNVAKITRAWQNVLGSRYESALSSRASAESALTDSDDQIRLVAYQIEWSHWHPRTAAGQIYSNAAANDRNERVRLRAIQCLSEVFKGSADEQIASLLANIIIDEKNSKILRANAYHALLVTQSLLKSTQNFPFDRAAEVFVFNADGLAVAWQSGSIDWSIVRKFHK
jgi:hypothetical protein